MRTLRRLFMIGVMALYTAGHPLRGKEGDLLQAARVSEEGAVIFVPITIVPLVRVASLENNVADSLTNLRALVPTHLRLKTYAQSAKQFFYKKFVMETEWKKREAAIHTSQLSLKIDQCLDRSCEILDRLGEFVVSGFIEPSGGTDHRFRFRADDIRVFNVSSSDTKVAFSIGDDLRQSQHPMNRQLLGMLKGKN